MRSLTVKQAAAVLVPFHNEAQAGRLITARGIKTRYQTRVGHHVPDSTVYRLLARHPRRQVTPRLKPHKNNPAARASFKKTPGQSGRGGGWTPGPALAPDV